jgi:hypothetical protein
VQAQSAEAKGLEGRLLRREPGGKVPSGPGAGVCRPELARGEDALGESRAPLERTLEPFDLDQVDAGAADHSARPSVYRWIAASSS